MAEVCLKGLKCLKMASDIYITFDGYTFICLVHILAMYNQLNIVLDHMVATKTAVTT